MLWKKKEAETPPVPIERMVMVDLWYYDEHFPNVLQSWTWQTVDTAPDFPRARQWLSAMSEVCTVHHWHIREFDRPVPNYKPELVMPIEPTIQ